MIWHEHAGCDSREYISQSTPEIRTGLAVDEWAKGASSSNIELIIGAHIAKLEQVSCFKTSYFEASRDWIRVRPTGLRTGIDREGGS